MKKLLLLLLFAQSALAGWLHITDWTSYPGARVKGQCMAYSAAVQTDLESRKLLAHEVRYRWVQGDKKGNHAVVLFRYAGEWFIVDNERCDPVKVSRYATATGDWSDAGMLKAVKFFSQTATEIYHVN